MKNFMANSRMDGWASSGQSAAAQQPFDGPHHVGHGEAELFEQGFRRTGGAEAIQTDGDALGAFKGSS
jgi:hypothetical protein